MAVDLLIRNVTLVSPAGQRRVNISISAGAFSAILDSGVMPFVPARETIDATGLVALPGLIDGHVHFREPGLTHEETWLTGTRSAVFGGVTTVLDMPNTVPPTDSIENARAKLALADLTAYCDYGSFGLFGTDLGNVGDLATSGLVVGLKAFLGPTTGNLPTPEEEGLFRGLELARLAGLRVAFHAEDRATIDAEREHGTRTDPTAHLESRPAEAEVRAIEQIAGLLQAARAQGHICHVSSAMGLDAIQSRRSEGVDLTCEVTPHHALLGREVYADFGGVAKVNPPIRGEPDATALLAALADGRIDMVASDHAPHVASDKVRASIWDVPSGFAGVETLLPLMLTAVHDGRLTLERLAHATSEAPAKTWGLWPRKGQVAVGADADLTLVDLERAGEIHAADLHGMNNVSPFEDRATTGAIVTTIVRGRVVVRDGQLVGQPGWGQPVRTNSRSSSTA
ncbi:MAG TPA: dihydroorotase family protein [Candidatus Limnocylindria bacterium]|nr:dihydroorotase family protein [Candidatus Limnocylindria bacterium]